MQMPWEIAQQRRKQTPVQGADPYVYSIPDPKLPGEMAIQGQTIQRNAAQLGLTDEEARKAEADARKAEADARIAEATAQGAGQMKTAELNQQDEYRKRRAKVESATRQLQIVEGLFREDFQGGGLLQSIRELMPEFLSEQNSQFNSAAAGLQALTKPIFKVPGEGAFTDRDAAELAEANRPTARDRDAKIAQKLDNTRNAIDAERAALGLPAIDWEAKATPPGMDATQQRVGASDVSQGEAQLSTKSRTVEDPTLRAIGLQLGRMVAGGVGDAEILNFLQKAGVNPGETNVSEILKYRRNPEFQEWKRQNPNKPYPIGESFWQKEVPVEGVESLFNKGAQSPYGAATAGFANAVTGNRLDDIAGAVGGNPERVQVGQRLLQEERPLASLGGDIAGQMALEAIMGRVPGGRALLNSTWGRRGADAVYGAYAGSGAAEDDSFSAAVSGALANTAGGAAGRTVQRGAGTAIRGVQDEGLKYLNERGIDLTLGEIARTADNVPGRLTAWSEDRLAGLPGTDALINSARYRGAQSFNRAALGEAAGKPITETGEAGVQQLGKAVSDAYKGALSGVSLTPDKAFNTQFRGLVARGSRLDRYGGDYKALTDDISALFKGGKLDGEGYQEAMQLIRSTRADFAGQPGFGRFNKELNHLEDAMTNLAGRQAPNVVPALKEANKLNRNLKIIQRATGGMAAQRNDGLISPQQLNQASIQNTKKFGGENLAISEDRPFYDLSKAAMDAMGQQIPDSGTAGRTSIIPLIGAAMAAGGEGAGAAFGQDSQAGQAGDYGTTLGLLTMAASAPYSKTGQKLIQKGLLGERPPQIDAVGKLLQEYPWLAGLLGSAISRDQFVQE